MLIHLHNRAIVRHWSENNGEGHDDAEGSGGVQASAEPASVLAERFGSLEDQKTIRGSFFRRGLTPAQEAVAVVLRKSLLVPLDDLLAVVREYLNPNVSRSGLDRCLRRHGVGNLRDLQAQSPRPKHKAFNACEPGYLHVGVEYLPQMADEYSRRYLFVAIDRATRWVFISPRSVAQIP